MSREVTQLQKDQLAREADARRVARLQQQRAQIAIGEENSDFLLTEGSNPERSNQEEETGSTLSSLELEQIFTEGTASQENLQNLQQETEQQRLLRIQQQQALELQAYQQKERMWEMEKEKLQADRISLAAKLRNGNSTAGPSQPRDPQMERKMKELENKLREEQNKRNQLEEQYSGMYAQAQKQITDMAQQQMMIQKKQKTWAQQTSIDHQRKQDEMLEAIRKRDELIKRKDQELAAKYKEDTAKKSQYPRAPIPGLINQGLANLGAALGSNSKERKPESDAGHSIGGRPEGAPQNERSGSTKANMGIIGSVVDLDEALKYAEESPVTQKEIHIQRKLDAARVKLDKFPWDDEFRDEFDRLEAELAEVQAERLTANMRKSNQIPQGNPPQPSEPTFGRSQWERWEYEEKQRNRVLDEATRTQQEMIKKKPHVAHDPAQTARQAFQDFQLLTSKLDKPAPVVTDKSQVSDWNSDPLNRAEAGGLPSLYPKGLSGPQFNQTTQYHFGVQQGGSYAAAGMGHGRQDTPILPTGGDQSNRPPPSPRSGGTGSHDSSEPSGPRGPPGGPPGGGGGGPPSEPPSGGGGPFDQGSRDRNNRGPGRQQPNSFDDQGPFNENAYGSTTADRVYGVLNSINTQLNRMVNRPTAVPDFMKSVSLEDFNPKKETFQEWLPKFEMMCAFLNVMEDSQKIFFMLMKLKPEASSVIRVNPDPRVMQSYQLMRQTLLNYYADRRNHIDKAAEFEKIKQGSRSVEDYIREFEEFAMKAYPEEMTKFRPYIYTTFTRGLATEIQHYLIISGNNAPDSTATMFENARRAERIVQDELFAGSFLHQSISSKAPVKSTASDRPLVPEFVLVIYISIIVPVTQLYLF